MRALVVMMVVMAGCGGRLDDPQSFNAGSTSATTPTVCDAEAVVLRPHCGSCHSATTSLGGLDLTSDGAAARLVDHASAGCGGKLIDSADETKSVLLERLDASSCGSAMPPGAALSATERQCLSEWVKSAAYGAK